MPRLPASFQARLAAWPGVVAFLSVLAVVLGQQHTRTELPRVAAAPHSPALPEVRPAPPAPQPVPLPGTPAPEPFRLPAPPPQEGRRPASWSFLAPRPDLAWWGRRQTDGG